MSLKAGPFLWMAQAEVYNTLMPYFRSHGFTFASGACTGIAATLLTSGKSNHSLFKLPVLIVETSTCNITPTSSHAQYLRFVTAFILHEATMIPVDTLLLVDARLGVKCSCWKGISCRFFQWFHGAIEPL